MQGTVSGGRYASPDGCFSVAVPIMRGGGRFQENLTASSFTIIMTDDTGTLYRAEGLRPPLPPRFAGMTSRASADETLKANFALIRSACPAARVIRSRFDPTLLDGAMVAHVAMPAGSVAMVQKNDGPWQRPDSQRVLVIFKTNGALVVISHHGGDLPGSLGDLKRQREINAGDERRAVAFARSVRYQPTDPNQLKS